MKRWIRFELIATFVLLLWALGSLPILSWLPDLASHFQMQYFVLFATLGLISLFRKKWRWSVLLLVALAVCFNTVQPYLFFGSPEKTGQPTLRVMQANVLLTNHDFDRIIETIAKYDPDVLSLQEVDPASLNALQSILSKYPYHMEHVKRHRFFGLALYSKFPLKKSRIEYFGGVGRPNLVSEIRFSNQLMTILATHPYSPGKSSRYKKRNLHLLAMAKERKRLGENLIVMGDLNNTPFSPSFKTFMKETGLKNPREGRGFYPTWHALIPFLWIPIDHILVSPNFNVVSMQTGPYIGSDHLPIVVDLTLKSKTGK